MFIFLAAFGFIFLGAMALTAAKQRSHPWNALAAEVSERLHLTYEPPTYADLASVSFADRLGTLTVTAVPGRHLLVRMASHRVHASRYFFDEADHDVSEGRPDDYRIIRDDGGSQRGDSATAKVVFQRLQSSPLCRVVPGFRVGVLNGEVSVMVPAAAVDLDVTVAAIEEARALVVELARASLPQASPADGEDRRLPSLEAPLLGDGAPSPKSLPVFGGVWAGHRSPNPAQENHPMFRLEPVEGHRASGLDEPTAADESDWPSALDELLLYAPGMATELRNAAATEGRSASAGALLNRCALDQGAELTDELVELLNVSHLRQEACAALAIAGDLRAVAPLQRVVKGFLPGWVVRSAADRAITAIQNRTADPNGGSLSLSTVARGSNGGLAMSPEAAEAREAHEDLEESEFC